MLNLIGETLRSWTINRFTVKTAVELRRCAGRPVARANSFHQEHFEFMTDADTATCNMAQWTPEPDHQEVAE